MSFGDWTTYGQKRPPSELTLMVDRSFRREAERITAHRMALHEDRCAECGATGLEIVTGRATTCKAKSIALPEGKS